METIKSAEEILKDKVFKLSNLGGFELETIEAILECAKLHVIACKQEIIKNAKITRNADYELEIDADSILNSYSLENIK